MMTFDKHDEGARSGARSDAPERQLWAALRSLKENGVDITGSESGAELTIMQTAVEAFRRAAELLDGRTSPAQLEVVDDPFRRVVPPRAADETPRRYSERVNRMTERFRSLTESPGRDRPR
jgi:hypothetical protein